MVLQRPVAIRLQLQQSSQWGLQLCVVLQRPVAIRLQPQQSSQWGLQLWVALGDPGQLVMQQLGFWQLQRGRGE